MPRWEKIPSKNWDRAKAMRTALTPAELKLWLRLRNSQLGFRVRRQHLIGPYIVDFCLSQHKLIIEIDGDVHASEDAKQHDEVRRRWLEDHGYSIIRYTNREILENIENVLIDLTSHVPPLYPPR
jgi:very-short-patch-repair endonuclease